MKKLTKKRKHDIFMGYLFTSPWILGFLFFIVFPLITSFYLSFTRYDILSAPRWIGLQNWIRMFTQDPRFWNATKATFKYVIFEVPLRLLFAFIVALIFSQRESKILNLYRAIYYIPSLIGGSVAIAVVWRQIWGYPDGIVNAILSILGLKGMNWLGDTRTAIWTLILLAVWQFGSPMLIFLAALKQVPTELYEAATIDGANFWGRLFKITIPMVTPVILFNLINQMIHAFMAFTQSYIITQGGPLDSTLFYAVYMYRKAFNDFEMGYASALAWFMLTLVGIFTIIIFKTSNRWVYYEAEEGV
ncbi:MULTISPECIES: carbohydrate ABC transporter permease [Dictyoglomus]|jgi:multiple sugar transport system permease protein|uniref:Binding-protein-dependent transport systems inner membrane component n=1 Tax=Dictyoglomus turgidum (strain DSM 6724 / Z-1310) TaxID=515635 RepID=B8E1V7_DICTD|nr:MULTISPECIES: sugar ABC transporter permease [Dictyoglomus]ACK41740.1 binding-protein-dependent transport systems inner membrane component [Dictyoglomus turgidum DSM 6724]HBU31763.1 sugar ABC transporter permease [Dictyoglomus sp.]